MFYNYIEQRFGGKLWKIIIKKEIFSKEKPHKNCLHPPEGISLGETPGKNYLCASAYRLPSGRERREKDCAQENKKTILENMRNANINIEGYVDTISTNIDETGGQVVNLLENILSTFGNLKVENTTNYNDMKNVVNNISQLSPEEMLDVLNALVGL